MEAFAIHKQPNAMSREECAIRLQKAIDHVHSIERLLDEKVKKEMESLVTKHGHIQSELNE